MLSEHRLKKNLILGTLILLLLGCAVALITYAAGENNPRADLWRLVRQGTPGYTSLSSEGHHVLINNGGEIWREFRNIILITVSPWIMGAMLIVIGLFHLITGGDKLEEPRSGIKVERYSLFERILHWFTAALFIIMAVTGLSILLGRAFLIPVLGHDAFSGYLNISKILHNWCGPLFLAGIVLEFIFWARMNIIRKLDLTWLKSVGGMIGKGPKPHAEKVHGGEKMWFWSMIMFGLGVGITGVLLDFPIWGQTRQTMQISLGIHAAVAVLFVTASFVHMYMGLLGSEGALEGMWRGKVDKVWAQQHADLWYEKIAEKESEP